MICASWNLFVIIINSIFVSIIDTTTDFVQLFLRLFIVIIAVIISIIFPYDRYFAAIITAHFKVSFGKH